MEVCSNLILLRGQDIDRFYKQFLNGFLVQMGRCAFLTAVKFMIALPYGFPILARGMPYFGTVPTCAVSAFYFSNLKTLPASSLDLDWHQSREKS